MGREEMNALVDVPGPKSGHPIYKAHLTEERVGHPASTFWKQTEPNKLIQGVMD